MEKQRFDGFRSLILNKSKFIMALHTLSGYMIYDIWDYCNYRMYDEIEFQTWDKNVIDTEVHEVK